MNEKELFKKFKKIKIGKENEGYIEWKKVILEEIKKMDEHLLQNMYYRYKFKVKDLSKTHRKLKISTLIVNLIGAAIPIIAAIIGAFMVITDRLTSIATEMADYLNSPEEVFRTAIDIEEELMAGILTVGTILVIGVLLYFSISWIVDEICISQQIEREIYNEEMVKILREEIRKRDSEKIVSDRNDINKES